MFLSQRGELVPEVTDLGNGGTRLEPATSDMAACNLLKII